MDKIFTNFQTLHIPMLAYSLGTFFLVAIISFIIQIRLSSEHLSAKEFISHCFPFEGWKKKSARIDVVVYLGGKLFKRLDQAVEIPVLMFCALSMQALLTYIFPDFTPIAFGYFTAIIASILIFLAFDFGKYISHYLEHFVPVLWELHKVHHSATFLNIATTDRLHPVENLFDRAFVAVFTGTSTGIVAFVCGLSIPEILLLFGNVNVLGTILVLDIVRHSHFPISFGPLDKYVLSPHMHHLHHSSQVQYWDKNFGGKLSIWDRMFGTYVKPAKNEKFVYGLGKAEEEDHNTIAGVYLSPLTKIWNLIYSEVEETPGSPSSARKRRFNFGEGVLWRHQDVSEYYPDPIIGPTIPAAAPTIDLAAQPSAAGQYSAHQWRESGSLLGDNSQVAQQPST